MKISELPGGIKTVPAGPRVGHFIIDVFMIEIMACIIAWIPLFELSSLLSLLLWPVYYIFFEFYFQYTPGKYITGTIVIDEYGNKPDLQTIILRTFIRFVPFEPFSCLGGGSLGWHDRWSGTYVINKEELTVIREHLGLAVTDDIPAARPSSGKMKKNVLIVLILFIVGISGYYIIQKVNEVMNFNFDALNETDRKMIRGEWDSDWKIYRTLNFKNDTLVTAVNQNGDELELGYMINTKILTLKDTNGLKLEYVIIEITGNKMILRDLKTMKDNIEFQKK